MRNIFCALLALCVILFGAGASFAVLAPVIAPSPTPSSPVQPNAPKASVIGSAVAGYADGFSADAAFRFPRGLFYDEESNRLLVADSGNHLIRAVYLNSGRTVTVAGRSLEPDALGMPRGGHLDGDAENALFNMPSGLAYTRAGTIIVADSGNHAIRQIKNGVVTTICGGTEGMADGYRQTARFSYPVAVAVDATGDIYVADKGNNAIRRVDRQGKVTTLPVKLNAPTSIVVEPSGGLLVTDSGNHRIVRISGSHMTVVTEGSTEPGYRNGELRYAQFAYPGAVAIRDRVVYVADTYNHVVRRIENDRAETCAGFEVGRAIDGPEIAQFDKPMGIAVSADELFVADTDNHRIVRISKLSQLRPITVLEKSAALQIYVDGVRLNFTTAPPFALNGRTYVHSRTVLRFGGTSIQWVGEDQSIVISKPPLELKLSAADGGIILGEGVTYMKLITIKDAFGYDVEWNGEHNAVLIRTK